jgi:hypothetical protein
MAGDERDAEGGGLDDHLAGALGGAGGGGPVTLVEVLSARLVEETRREVSVATRAVGELAGRIGQLEHDLAHVRHLVEHAEAHPPPVAVEALRAEMAALRSSVDGLVRDGARGGEPVPVAAAAPEPVDLSPVTEALGAGLAGLRMAVEELVRSVAGAGAAPPAPDLGPVTQAVGARADELRALLDEIAERVVGRAGTADVQELGERLAGHVATVQARVDELAGAVATPPAPPPPPDLAPVTEGLTALRARLDELAAAVATPPAPPDLAPVLEVVEQQGMGHRAAIEGLTRALADDHEAMVAQVDAHMQPLRPVVTAVEELQSRLEAMAGEQREQVAGAVDRMVAAVEANRATVEERLAAVAALGERTDAVAALVTQLGEQVGATRNELARWGDPETRQAEVQQVMGAVEAATSRLETRMQAQADGVDAGVAAARAALDELRVELRNELTGAAGFAGQTARLEELQAAVTATQESVVAVGADAVSRTQAVQQSVQDSVAAVRAEADGRSQAVQQSVQQSVEAVQQAVEQARSEMAGRAQATEAAVTAATERLGEQLRAAVEAVGTAVADLRTVLDERGPVPELERALTVLTEIRWDVEATQERVNEVDRKMGGMRGDLADTAQLTHAGFQAAEAVSAGLTALARLERRLDADLDAMTRQLDALAAAVELSVTAAGRPRETVTRDQVAERVSQRLTRYREVAAGVRDAVREDFRRRRGGGELGPGRAAPGEGQRR